MPRFRMTYVRTSYMDTEVEAGNCHDAERDSKHVAATMPAIDMQEHRVVRRDFVNSKLPQG